MSYKIFITRGGVFPLRMVFPTFSYEIIELTITEYKFNTPITITITE